MEVSGSGFYLSPCVRKKLPVAGSVDFVLRVFNGREGCIEKSSQYTLFHFRKKSVSSADDYAAYEKYFVDQLPYTDDELVAMSKESLKELKATAASVSIADAESRSGK